MKELWIMDIESGNYVKLTNVEGDAHHPPLQEGDVVYKIGGLQCLILSGKKKGEVRILMGKDLGVVLEGKTKSYWKGIHTRIKKSLNL